MIRKITDNIFSITDKIRIKFTTSLLDSSNAWINKNKDSVYYNRVIRWDLRIDCTATENSLKSISSVNLTGGDLFMLENLLTNVVLNDWFLNYKYGKNGSLSVPAQGLSRNLILSSGGVIIFTPRVLGQLRAVNIQLSNELEFTIDEFKVRDLIYFLKKFDPYSYANISACLLENKPEQHLSNMKKNFFDSKQIVEPNPPTPTIKGKQIGDRMKILL